MITPTVTFFLKKPKPASAPPPPILYVIGSPGTFLPEKGLCFDDYPTALKSAGEHNLYVLSFPLCKKRNPAECENLVLVPAIPSPSKKKKSKK